MIVWRDAVEVDMPGGEDFLDDAEGQEGDEGYREWLGRELGLPQAVTRDADLLELELEWGRRQRAHPFGDLETDPLRIWGGRVRPAAPTPVAEVPAPVVRDVDMGALEARVAAVFAAPPARMPPAVEWRLAPDPLPPEEEDV